LHSRSNSGIAKGGILILVLIVVGIIIGVAWWYSTQGTSAFTVSGVSLNPSEVVVNKSALFNFTIKNNDAVEPHNVMLIFNTTSPLTFFKDGSPLPNSEGLPYFQMSLNAGQQSTYSLTVIPTSTGGALTSTYPINAEFYFNSTRFDTETVSLTVDSS